MYWRNTASIIKTSITQHCSLKVKGAKFEKNEKLRISFFLEIANYRSSLYSNEFWKVIIMIMNFI